MEHFDIYMKEFGAVVLRLQPNLDIQKSETGKHLGPFLEIMAAEINVIYPSRSFSLLFMNILRLQSN